VHRFLSPWWRRRQVPPKRRFLQEPHGVTTQKTPFYNLLCFLCVSTRDNSFPCFLNSADIFIYFPTFIWEVFVSSIMSAFHSYCRRQWSAAASQLHSFWIYSGSLLLLSKYLILILKETWYCITLHDATNSVIVLRRIPQEAANWSKVLELVIKQASLGQIPSGTHLEKGLVWKRESVDLFSTLVRIHR
jgi:hypothetical protein